MDHRRLTLKITFLGTGTSTGVPVIGCLCDICQSPHKENKRLRSSILIQESESDTSFVIDTTPDFRTQILKTHIKHLDGVLYTHTHADHCHGFDDLRAFFFHKKKPIPCWLSATHQKELIARFSYAFGDTGYQGTKPQVELKTIEPWKSFSLGPLEIEPVSLPHGNTQSIAFRIGNFAYATDFLYFPDEVIQRWKHKIDLFIVSGLHYGRHPTHSTIQESIELAQSLGAKKTYITHLSHKVDHRQVQKNFPESFFLAEDELEIVHHL